jgi:hypothetical protein
MPDMGDIINKRFTTSSGKDVKDTKMLKGEAQNSLTGTNSTVQDSRSSEGVGKTGGKPTVKG